MKSEIFIRAYWFEDYG